MDEPTRQQQEMKETGSFSARVQEIGGEYYRLQIQKATADKLDLSQGDLVSVQLQMEKRHDDEK